MGYKVLGERDIRLAMVVCYTMIQKQATTGIH
jgi:hypothetical protein